MAPSSSRNLGSISWYNSVQRARKRFVNLAKQDPGRAKQNSQATAGTNFTKPRTSHLRDLCSFPIAVVQGDHDGLRNSQNVINKLYLLTTLALVTLYITVLFIQTTASSYSFSLLYHMHVLSIVNHRRNVADQMNLPVNITINTVF